MTSAEVHNEPGRTGWTTLCVCLIVTVAMFLPYVGYSTQSAVLMKELGLNYTQLGGLSFASAILSAALMPIVGVAVDRWGSRRVSLVGIVWSAATMLLFSLSPHYLGMLAVRLLQGIGFALLFIGPYSLVLRWFSGSSSFGVAVGLMSATDGIGTLLALYPFAAIQEHWGWRLSSAGAAMLLLLMAVLGWYLMRDPPGFEERHRADRADSAAESKSRFQWHAYLAKLSHTDIFVATAFLIGVWGSYGIAVYWVPTILGEQGWSDERAGLVGALYALAGTISSILFGYLADVGGRRKLLILISGIGTSMSFLAAAVALRTGHFGVLAALLPISGFFAYGGLPLAFCLGSEAAAPSDVATINGFMTGVGLLLGGMAYPFALGIVRDATGDYFFGFLAGGLSLMVLNVFTVPFFRGRRDKSLPQIATLMKTEGDVSPI